MNEDITTPKTEEEVTNKTLIYLKLILEVIFMLVIGILVVYPFLLFFANYLL
ncbi:MAG: hypothetical protein ACFFFH_00105 [Candidatus Thorarchaeota archaeon]